MSKRLAIIVGENSNGVFGVNSTYLQFVTDNFGEAKLISAIDPLFEEELNNVDGLILPGGSDIDFSRYAKWPHWQSGKPNPFLELFDTQILPKIVGKLPIIGICRGMQTLNVIFGGDLIPHLRYHPYSSYEDDLCHKVIITGKKYDVNSFHHQAVKNVATNFTPLALAEDGVVESFEDKSAKIFAVQWHPERFNDFWTIKKINELLG